MGVQVVRECLLQDGRLNPFHDIVLRLALADETSIAPALNTVAASFSGQVSLGSYPVWDPHCRQQDRCPTSPTMLAGPHRRCLMTLVHACCVV